MTPALRARAADEASAPDDLYEPEAGAPAPPHRDRGICESTLETCLSEPTQEELRDLFAEHGEVQDCVIPVDRDSGRSRGFGFVDMDDEEARNAITALDGYDMDGRQLRVNEARPRGSAAAAAVAGTEAVAVVAAATVTTAAAATAMAVAAATARAVVAVAVVAAATASPVTTTAARATATRPTAAGAGSVCRSATPPWPMP